MGDKVSYMRDKVADKKKALEWSSQGQLRENVMERAKLLEETEGKLREALKKITMEAAIVEEKNEEKQSELVEVRAEKDEFLTRGVYHCLPSTVCPQLTPRNSSRRRRRREGDGAGPGAARQAQRQAPVGGGGVRGGLPVLSVFALN